MSGTIISVLLVLVAASSSAPTTSIGILAQGYFYKGLVRDAECLIWALRSQNIVLGEVPDLSISVFYARGYVEVEETVLKDEIYLATGINEAQSATLFPLAVFPFSACCILIFYAPLRYQRGQFLQNGCRQLKF